MDGAQSDCRGLEVRHAADSLPVLPAGGRVIVKSSGARIRGQKIPNNPTIPTIPTMPPLAGTDLGVALTHWHLHEGMLP